MTKYFLILLAVSLLTGCSLSAPPPATINPPPSPSTVSDSNQQLLESLDAQATFDFESEFNSLEEDLL